MHTNILLCNSNKIKTNVIFEIEFISEWFLLFYPNLKFLFIVNLNIMKIIEGFKTKHVKNKKLSIRIIETTKEI